MHLKAISSPKAPRAIGPYSQAVRAHDFLFISGQLPLDSETLNLIEGDIRDQTRLVLEHLGAILKASGLDYKDVVKCELFLTQIADFGAVNEVYGEFFTSDPKPARQAFEVSALPRKASIEISCVAAFESK